MAITIKHAKTDTISDWTQADLDAQIAAGNYPPGTVLADIVLPSDWNNDHTFTGTLGVSNGGTGVTTSSGANSVVLRDANQNIAVNSVDDAYVNRATGTAITLTAGSARRYTITGSGGQTIKLPDATTLSSGAIFQFDNNQTSGAITVNNNSNTLIVSVPSGGYVLVNLLSNATAAGSWDRHDQAPSNVSWSTNTFDYAGSITSATWNGTAIALNRGGTNANLTAVNGGAVYSTGTALAISAAGTSGQVLTSSGAGAPTWTTLTTGTVTSVGISAPSIFTVTNSPVTSSGTLTLTYSGTALPIANGGTNATTAAGANANLQGFTTTATSATPVALTNTSTYYQYFTGTLTQTITLPLNTDIQNGWSFHIANNSTGNLTINSNSGALVNTVLPGTTVHVTCVDATVNTAAAWDSGTTDFATVTGTGSVVLSTSPTLVTPALGTPASGTLTNCTGLLATGGGTGLSTYTTGDTLYSSAANTLSKLAIGTTGQVLSIASGIPAWSSSSSASVFTTGSSQTYTVPAGVTRVKVTIQGPGGNGGASASGRATGGSAGATVIKWLTVTPGDTMTYTVGTASGTNSTVVYSATTYTAASGSNGTSTAYAASLTAGPTGGTGTNGDINITGGRGGNSYGSSTTITTNFSGDGANSQFGQGGKALAFVATAGQNGTGYGSGGSGAIGNATGGTGAGGITIFEPY